jgi:hypothetical protein
VGLLWACCAAWSARGVRHPNAHIFSPIFSFPPQVAGHSSNASSSANLELFPGRRLVDLGLWLHQHLSPLPTVLG